METQIQRLFKYLMKLHASGKACVFIRMSGHVEQIEIEVCESIERYQLKLYERSFYFLDRKYSLVPKNKDWKKYVDEIIEDIEFALTEREAKAQKAVLDQEERDRATYIRLKEKFEKA